MTSNRPTTSHAGTSRRSFLLRTAGAATAAGIAAAFPSLARIAANDRIGVGFIGCGHRQWSHLNSVYALKTLKRMPVELVAACDVYRPRLNDVVDEFKKRGVTIRAYADHLSLLRDPRVDVVCIATPDHQHAQQTIDAARAGKAVYCEVPFTHTRQIDQLKQAVAEVKRNGVVFQLGTHDATTGAWRQARALIQAGSIGKPFHAECGMSRDSRWGESVARAEHPNARPGRDLDWAAFLGDAPKTEFDVERLFGWRRYSDYASGPAADIFHRCFAPVVSMTSAGVPDRVLAIGGAFERRAGRGVERIHWVAEYPHKMSVDMLGALGRGDGRAGASVTHEPVVRGAEGTLTFRKEEIVLVPQRGASQHVEIERSKSELDHWADFLACVRNRDVDTANPIELAHQLQTTLNMGAWSLQHEAAARFDAATNAIVA